MSETKFMWLWGGQFHCDAHRPYDCIPFYFAPEDAKCAECHPKELETYLNRNVKVYGKPTFRRVPKDSEIR